MFGIVLSVKLPVTVRFSFRFRNRALVRLSFGLGLCLGLSLWLGLAFVLGLCFGFGIRV